MNSNHLKTFCIGLILGLGFHACAMLRIEKVEKEEITLQSQDGQNVSIPKKLAELSKTIKNLIEDADTDSPIPLPPIDGKTLALIAKLLPHLQELIHTYPDDPSWPAKSRLFIGLEFRPRITQMLADEYTPIANLEERRSLMLDQAVKLLFAANHLDIPYLTDSAAAVIADLIPYEARAAALKFLTATPQEEEQNILITTAKDELIRRNCGSLLTIPHILRAYVLLNLSFMQAVQLHQFEKIPDLESLKAALNNPHFAPSAFVVSWLRNNFDLASALVNPEWYGRLIRLKPAAGAHTIEKAKKRDENPEINESEDLLTLQSQDGQVFKTPVRLAKLSETIKNLIEDAGIENPIPLPNLDGRTLSLIIQLLPGLQKLIDQNPHDPDWPAKARLFIGLNLRPLITRIIVEQSMTISNLNERKTHILDQAVKLLFAANYLDIPYLIDSSAAVVADFIPKEARQAALKFLTATSAEEVTDREVIAAKESLIKLQCGSLLSLPRLLRRYVTLNLLFMQSADADDLIALRAALDDSHFIPGALVIEWMRNNTYEASQLVNPAWLGNVLRLPQEFAPYTEDSKVTFQSNDGQTVTIPMSLAFLSVTAQKLVQAVGIDKPLHLPNIDGKTLSLIMRLLPILQTLSAQSPYSPHEPAHRLLIGIELQPILTTMIEEEFSTIANFDERRSLMLDQAIKLFLAAQYLHIRSYDNQYLMESLPRVLWNFIPKDAQKAALTFLAASDQEENNNEQVKSAKEVLIKHQCTSLLTISQEQRQYLLFKLQQFANA